MTAVARPRAWDEPLPTAPEEELLPHVPTGSETADAHVAPDARVALVRIAIVVVLIAVSTMAVREVLLSRFDQEVETSLVEQVERLRSLARSDDPATGRPFGTDTGAIFDAYLATNDVADDEAVYTIVAARPYKSSPDAPADLLDDPELVDQWANLERPERRTVSTPVGSARTLAIPLRHDSRTAGVAIVAAFTEQERGEVEDRVREIAFLVGLVLLVVSLLVWSRRTGTPAQAPRPAERPAAALLPVAPIPFAEARPVTEPVPVVEPDPVSEPVPVVAPPLQAAEDIPPPADPPAMHTLANVTDHAETTAASSELHLAVVDLSELADRVYDKARATGEREWVLEETSPPEQQFVLADAESLSEAMRTIASDAASHTAPGDRITLGVVLRDDELRLWMHDDGTGNPSSWHRLYTRFGGGNVFATVMPIARAHGGRFDVVGAPGRGATFTIVIPTEPVPA